MAEDKTQEPAAGTEPDSGAGTDTKDQPTITQEDLNRLDAKNRRKLQTIESERDKLAAKLKEFEDGQKTEQEKLIEAAAKAKAETDAIKSQLDRERISARLSTELLRLGIPDSLAPAVQAGAEITGPDDVAGAVKAWLEANPWIESIKKLPPPPGQGGSPGPRKDTSITEDDIRKMSPEEFRRRAGEIMEARARERG